MRASVLTICLGLLVSISIGAAGLKPAQAAFTNFDSLSEGFLTSTFTDGGITFFDSLDFNGFSSVFSAEQANGTLSGPFFSPNNVLGQGGFSAGPGAAFPATGTFKMTTGSVENFVSIEVFTFGSNHIGNSLNLEILLGGSVVGTTSFTVTGSAITHQNLSISGTNFDTARIFGTGSYQNGTVFARFDNAQLGAIPEPSTGVLLLLAAAGGLVGRRRRQLHR